MDEVKVIEIKKSVFEDNDKDAARLRAELKSRGVYLLNLMSSPGSGKTTTLIQLIGRIKDKIKAAVSGARQVAGAVAASTLTTVCVFIPIAFLSGTTKELFTDMVLTLSFALLASLVAALTLVPAMAGKLLEHARPPREGA